MPLLTKRKYVWMLILLCAPASSSLAASPATTQSAVSVTMKTVNIQQKSFDPGNPPEGLPINPEVEMACSQALFSCHADVGFKVTNEKPCASGTEISAQIDSIHVTLCLDDTLWLPENASAKVLAHERGHAAISEKFFLKAQTPVEQAAAKLIGTSVGAEAKDHQAALDLAAQKVNDKIARIYAQQTTTASSPVQIAYDKLTDHSRNKVAEDKAIALAMKHATKNETTQASN